MSTMKAILIWNKIRQESIRFLQDSDVSWKKYTIDFIRKRN